MTLREVWKSYELRCVESHPRSRGGGVRGTALHAEVDPRPGSLNPQPESGISTRRAAAPCWTGRALQQGPRVSPRAGGDQYLKGGREEGEVPGMGLSLSQPPPLVTGTTPHGFAEQSCRIKY